MHDDIHQRRLERLSGTSSIARRREILKRIGKSSILAGAAASPLAAMAGGGRPFCRDPITTTKCVQASVSGMASVVLSAQAGNEVCSHKCSHYANSGNWPVSCTNGTTSGLTCNTQFKTAFKCPAGSSDSGGKVTGTAGCLLDKTLLDLCANYSGTSEAHWACALANANKCVNVSGYANFPYPPATVVDGHYQNASMRGQAYTFYSTYCEAQA